MSGSEVPCDSNRACVHKRTQSTVRMQLMEMSTNLEDLDLVLNVEATLHLRRNRARIRHPTATVL